MPALFRMTALAGAFALALAPARAEACEVLQLEFTPAAELQFAVWITRADGTFVDTVRVTRLVGTFGIGNRPGRASTEPGGGFKSNYHWPYGKRLEVLPVWAYGRGVFYPMLVMQDSVPPFPLWDPAREDWLGFHEMTSSDEPFFCKPQTLTESVDMTTCASEGFDSDKGIFEPGGAEVPYPPRNELFSVYPEDSGDMPTLGGLNDLDAVTMATPAAGDLVQIMYDASALPPGDYLVWIETNREGDANGDWWGDGHDCTAGPPGAGSLPCFTDCVLAAYGECLSGQPSVVWQIPFTIEAASTMFAATTLDYAGYGSPTGADGTVNAPDATITTGVNGSGAGRLLPVTETDGDLRFKVECDPVCKDLVAPGAVAMVAQVPPDETAGDDDDRVTIRLVHPADDDGGPVTSYEIRYAEGVGSLDASTFLAGIPGPSLMPFDPGSESELVLGALRANTTFTVGIRTRDECFNESEIVFLEVVTEREVFRTVPPCGCRVGAAGAPGLRGDGILAAVVVGAVALLRTRRRRARF